MKPSKFPRLIPQSGRAALLAAAVIGTGQLQAALWTGNTSNAYDVGANWDTNAAPGTGDDVEISSSANNPTNIPSGNWDRRNTGSTTTISGTGVVNLQTGQARFLNTGTFNISGGAFNQTGEYFIVGAGAVGTLNHSAGTVTSTLARSFSLSDNNINQSGTTYNLSGSAILNVTSTVTNIERHLGGVWFGKGGETGDSGSVGIGSATGDIFNVTGGTATFTRAIAGTPHGTNPSQLADVRISRNSGLLISGGSVTFDNYTDFRVGQGPSGGTNARVVLSGGTLDITGGTNFYLGEGDNGLLDISGGTLTLEGLLSLGRTGFSGTGTAIMTAGSLFAADIVHENGSFDFQGGLIRLQGDRESILGESWFLTANAPDTVVAEFDAGNNWTNIYVVPEPGSLLLALGALGIFGARRRR